MMLYFCHVTIFCHAHNSYEVPLDSFIEKFMRISCSAQSHWRCSSERLTEHTEIIDAVKTNVGAANEKIAMHHFQSYPTIFL